MKSITVIFKDSSYNYSTSVNEKCSDDEIRKYFIGKHFNFGTDENENFQLCIRIKIN